MKAGCRWCVLGMLVAAMSAGCRGGSGSAGTERTQKATYRGRLLSTDLPPQIRVPSIAAAAEMALRHRGYMVTRSPTTEDYTRVEGEPPDAGWGECVVVRARQTSSKTRIEVIAQPLGDQVLSRALLDDVLANLGI